MKPTVYVETSVISYLTSRPSRDIVVAGHQETTRQWWAHAPERFELVVSVTALDEMRHGDPEAIAARMSAVASLRVLPTTAKVEARATRLRKELELPAKALADVFHITYCIEYELDFLATWNSAHIANPHVLRRLRDLSHEESFFLPTIVTPDALLEDET